MTDLTTPNTPANGGQILTDERILELAQIAGKRYDSVNSMTTQATLEMGRAFEAEIRAADAAKVAGLNQEISAVAASFPPDEEMADLRAENRRLRASLAAPAIPTVDRNSVPNTVGFACPMPPPRNGQSSVLFDDGYEEGWAKAIDTVRAMLAAPASEVNHG